MAGLTSAYLDNSATTRPTQSVIEAMARCMRDGFYNPSSQYAPAVESERRLNECREEIARALRVTAEEIYFTSGGTEANNLAVLGLAALTRGSAHFLVNATEHPSVLAAYDEVKRLGHRVTVVPAAADGGMRLDLLEAAVKADPPTCVSCMQVNNETGAIFDIASIASIARAANPACRVHVDGVQGFLRVPFDARDIDLYTLSGHKLHGPKGVGALYVKKGLRLAPRQIGGGQEKGLRSGTENTPGIAGLLQAVRDLRAMPTLGEDLAAKKARFVALVRQSAPEAILNGPTPRDGAPHIVNFSFPGVRGEVMLHALEADGVYCSTGSACSSKKRHVSAVLTAMGIAGERAEGALRFSLSPLTTDEEIDYAADRIAAAYDRLKTIRRR